MTMLSGESRAEMESNNRANSYSTARRRRSSQRFGFCLALAVASFLSVSCFDSNVTKDPDSTEKLSGGTSESSASNDGDQMDALADDEGFPSSIWSVPVSLFETSDFLSASSSSASLSGDGSLVVFATAASLVDDDTNGFFDIYLVDTTTSNLSRVSLTSSGGQGNGNSTDPQISHDGAHVVFKSVASNLVPGDTNSTADIFVRQLRSENTVLVSRTDGGTQSSSDSSNPAISADGNVVVFESRAPDLVANDENAAYDIFRKDIETNRLTCVSCVAPHRVDPVISSVDSTAGSISADGKLVAFQSFSDDIVEFDNNGKSDIFVYDDISGVVQRVNENVNGEEPNGDSFNPQISANGQFLVYESAATNLQELPDNVSNGQTQIFRIDLDSSTVQLVSAECRW